MPSLYALITPGKCLLRALYSFLCIASCIQAATIMASEPSMGHASCLCMRPNCPAPLPFPDLMLFEMSSAFLGSKDVTIVRGQQGTVDWQQQRCGKIGGSMAYDCAHASSHQRKVDLCAQLCHCVDKSFSTEATSWGTNHEKAALLQYMIGIRMTSQVLQYYKGPIKRLDNTWWKDKKWQKEEHFSSDPQHTCVYTQHAKVDGEIQVLVNNRCWYNYSSPDAVVNPGTTDAAGSPEPCYGVEIKCPFSLVGSSEPLSAAEYLFAGNNGRPKWQYIYQLLQLQYLLPADWVDFVVWRPNSSGISECSVLRIVVEPGTYEREVMARLHPVASHYLWPMQQLLAGQTGFPSLDDLKGRCEKYDELSASFQEKKCCGCQAQRLCTSGCQGDCSCVCIASCLLPGQHCSSGAPCMQADGGCAAFVNVSQAALDFSSLQKEVLEEYWQQHRDAIISEYTTNDGKFAANWRRELRADLLEAEEQSVHVNIKKIAQYYVQRVTAEHAAAAESWVVSAEHEQQLHQYFVAGNRKATDKEIWKALDALNLPTEITFSHVKVWWQRKQQAQAAAGTSRSARSQQEGGTSGSGGRTRWFIKHPAARDSFLAAATELLTQKLSAADINSSKMTVVSGMTGKDVLQYMRKDSNNEEYQATVKTARLGAENVKGVFGGWQKNTLTAFNVPLCLESDVARRVGPMAALPAAPV